MMIYAKDASSRNKDPILAAKNMIQTLLRNIGIDAELSYEKTDSANYHPKKQAKIQLNGK